jgi:hypothetical protein
METALRTASFESAHAAIEGFLAQPWSDGLPVVPPTVDLVERMIAAGDRSADERLGTVPERNLSIDVWQAATCSVMAGCRPEYFPVVLATWDALLDPRFRLHTWLSTTGGTALAAIVSGPYADEIGMNSGQGLLSPGNRANATIGRAIRLGAMTALKAIPGQLDAANYGHAGKYTFHFAELAPPAPWRPIREQLGYPAWATTVTVMPAEAPRQVRHAYQPTAEELLRTFASAMRDPSQCGTGVDTTYMAILGGEHADIFIHAGLSTRQVREALSELSHTSIDELAKGGVRYDVEGTRYGPPDTNGRIRSAKPEHILVTTAGGYGGGWSIVIPSLTWTRMYLPTTRAVRVPGQKAVEREVERSELDFA